ncbi:MAG: hypothetical protein RLZZ584_446 [Pseudomonadota bacterium]
MRVSDDILSYYERELAYLREQGAEFAHRYPRVASKLAFSGTESPDPQTERLIESQAFLAARVHRDLDREYPQFAAALLEHLCPTLIQPVPAMTVVALQLHASQGKVTAGLRVPRHTALVAPGLGRDAASCRLRTAWDTVLWPLQVTHTRLVDGRWLQLQLRCDEGSDLAELELDSLSLHLGGSLSQAMALYELLVRDVTGVAVCDGQGRLLHRLSTRHWRQRGYDRDDGLLPRAPHGAPAYALLQEYFAFARKFHFFELDGLRGRLGRGRECEIRLELGRGSRLPAGLDAHALRTGCVPAINLFPRISEPIRVDPARHEYLLVGERSAAADIEVHSISSVHLSDPDVDGSQLVPAFGALDLAAPGRAAGVYWSARREPGGHAGVAGSEMWLAFSDLQRAPLAPRQPVVHARLLCSSRRLIEQLTPERRLQAEGLSTALQAHSLYPVSMPRPAPLSAQALWQLVSLLRLNHGSLVDAPDGVDALRAMLLLFCGQSSHELAQIRGLRSLRARPGSARIGSEGWRGHCRGTDVELEFDDDAFVGASPLLLSGVLAHFFALYTTLNSFVRLGVRRRNEVWHQWPPITGYQPLC